MTQWITEIELLSRFLEFTPARLLGYRDELMQSTLLSDLHAKAQALPEFRDGDLTQLESFSFYRTMLYLVVRTTRPQLFVETGVLNGFSSAFILQAMTANGNGHLISIDLPSRGLGLAQEGTADLPGGQQVGWAIPARLCDRHDLRLGRSEVLLPQLFGSGHRPDIFLHDSLHTYNHMMMEMTLAASVAQRGSLVIADNIDLNTAFADFCRGNKFAHCEIYSHNTTERVWEHGLAKV